VLNSMNTNPNTICVTSYNSGGIGVDRQNYIKTLLLFSDILCVQEHFLLDSGDRKHSNTNKLKQYFSDNHDMYIKPAFKSNNCLSKGRGSGGLVILWKKSLTKYVSNIKSENYRVQATHFKFPEAELLIFNLYFMVDPQTNNFNDYELLSLLAEIERIITATNCNNILLCGDINCDFSRNSNFVNIISNFIDRTGLKVFWNFPDNSENRYIANVRYTYSNTVNNVTHSSVIDHFLSNERLFNAVIEADVINSADNLSNHLPIYCKLKVDQLNLEMEENVNAPKPSWNRANEQQRREYEETLNNYLSRINTPELCDLCGTLQCQQHEEAVDEYASSICEVVEAAARECLPTAGGGGQRPGRGTSGWNEFVKPFQDESKFWHGVWQAAGQPNQGEIHEMYRTAKMQYKYAVRRLKRTVNRIQQNRFVNSLMQGGVNIFSEIKKFRGQCQNISSCIDGEVGGDNISAHFAEIYRDLYSSHTLGEEFVKVNDDINNLGNQELLLDVERVNTVNVRLALERLKSGKSDVTYSFNSDCLLKTSDVLIQHVTTLFKWFLRTGRVPAFLLLCTLVPIVKDNLGDAASSENYRAIAIGSLLLKWFDWLVLILEGDKLTTDELQFGFQANSSTTMCSWAVTAVVDYYNRSGRPVFACAMDLSKAFDLVSWEKLFPELLDRGVSPLILRCLLYIYSKQLCNVRWGTKVSQRFTVTNGVRQGAVSSPILFCVYIDKLIKLLRASNLGCQLPGVYLGIWVYADDIILLSPSRQALQEMVTICENFANSIKMKFSTNANREKSKTKCILFGKSNIDVNDIHPISLNGLPLPFVKDVKHLGNILECDNSMSKDCSIKRAQFISKIHALNQEFYFSTPETVLKLYYMYACSFYGSNLWNLYNDDVLKLYSSWNVAIRILYNLPRETHRYLIEPVSENLHIKTLLCTRFYTFYSSLSHCTKLAIRTLANIFNNDMRTVLCRNLNNIAADCNLLVTELSKNIIISTLKFSVIPPNEEWRIPLLKELLEIRNDDYALIGFANDDISQIIEFLCCD